MGFWEVNGIARLLAGDWEVWQIMGSRWQVIGMLFADYLEVIGRLLGSYWKVICI